ncbi:MAG: arsenic-transporting ATPase, partial [Chloroflexi bacterium CG15_BIG_FIL_POST_REV_8_21_14_020_46_15]
MEKVLDFMKGNDYDYIVWDTAPTGHTLRLLALPGNIATYAAGSIRLY